MITVTDPALAAILQRRRLLSEPQIHEATARSEGIVLNNEATIVEHTPTVRPGFVQDALAAIQDRQTFEPKSQPNVQCFDMATDSESDSESDDEVCNADRTNAQSSESTGDEELGSCSEGRPLCCAPAMDAELCQLMKVSCESTVGELRAAVNDQMSFNPMILARATHGGADQAIFLQLNDADVISTVVGNVEDLVLRNVLVLDHERESLSTPPSRLQVLEKENAELKARLERLEERLAATECHKNENEERITVEPEIGNGRDDEHVSPQTGDAQDSQQIQLTMELQDGDTKTDQLLRKANLCESQPEPQEVQELEHQEKLPDVKNTEKEPAPEIQQVEHPIPPILVKDGPQMTPVQPAAVPTSDGKRKGTPLCISLLSMQSPDQPPLKLEMTNKSTIAELRAEVMHVFQMDERTAKRLRFLRKRGTCYISFKEAECVREKIFLHDPDIRALSGLKLRSFSGVGGSRPTAEETSGLQHSLPAGVDDFMQEFILHTFARMNEEERSSWNALPKFVIWTMWFDILSSPFFRKCMEGKFFNATFGPNFDRKASMSLAKDDPVLREYAFHKRQLISVWFQEDEIKGVEKPPQVPEKPPEVPPPQVPKEVSVEKDSSGLFDFDDLDEAEMTAQR